MIPFSAEGDTIKKPQQIAGQVMGISCLAGLALLFLPGCFDEPPAVLEQQNSERNGTSA